MVLEELEEDMRAAPLGHDGTPFDSMLQMEHQFNKPKWGQIGKKEGEMQESNDLSNIDESAIKLNQVPINKSISKKTAFKQDQNGMVNPYLSFAD